ncbi:MAG: outer membrane lipoprotein carrier protein LolA [Myxococcota bacterium]|nr:outer membrane lipoprotein carrier protein LolA [Myxococcota bacterium]
MTGDTSNERTMGNLRDNERTVTRRWFGCGACLVFATRNARADAGAGDPFERIARARAPVRTVDAPFTQTRTIGLLATDVVSHGRLTLVRPDRLRWELSSPDDVTFWMNPEGLAYRTVHGSGRVPAAEARVATALDDLRTVVGGDLAKLHERWNVSVLRDDPDGIAIEALARRQSTAPLHRLRFSFPTDLLFPTSIELFDGPRDRTLVEFGTPIVNGPIDEKRMLPPR